MEVQEIQEKVVNGGKGRKREERGGKGRKGIWKGGNGREGTEGKIVEKRGNEVEQRNGGKSERGKRGREGCKSYYI